MGDRRYPRPRTPPLHNPGRSSLPNFGYPYTEVYTVPVRKDAATAPRIISERAPAPGPITTTYKVTPDLPPVRDVRDGHRHRRSTLDDTSRPTIVTAQPRAPAIHGGAGRPPSPLHDPYRSSGEGGEYMTIPASSAKRHSHYRQSSSATLDNADVQRIGRENGSRGMLGVGSGREGARYPRQRPVYPGSLVRHPDTVADDYGDNGYGYTNPRDLVQYDLNRPARYPPPRRDSYEGPRPARPSSISGYVDIVPRSYDNRERGPPPATRGLDKLAARSPLYDVPPVRINPGESGVRSPRREQFYSSDPPRQPTYRRPVTVYHDRPRRDEYYNSRDDDIRERRERPHYSKRYEERDDYRDRPQRDEENGYDNKRREHRSRKDYPSDNDSDDSDDHDDRAERKRTREKNLPREKDQDSRHEHDRKDDHGENKERKRDKLAAGMSVAAAALGVGAAAKSAKHDDSDDDRDQSDDPRRRRDNDEPRRRKEHRDDQGSVDLTGRDPIERNNIREDKDGGADDGGETKSRTVANDDKPVDLAGRNPQEKPTTRDTRDEVSDFRERKSKTDPAVDVVTPSSREDSPLSAEGVGRRRIHKEHGPGPDIPFKATNTSDLRALRDALNKKDGPPQPATPTETVREGSFERRREPNTQVESTYREGRGRHHASDEEDERRPTPRLVSPPREVKKSEDNKPKGILRPPREKFPEDPVPIREGVAPLKDAKNNGVPPDARWTKISRRMVNPEALEAGKERYEAREDFVIVLRVLTKEEIQAYAIATQQLRAAREQADEIAERRRRRERHERHKRERERGERESYHRERYDNHEYDHDHRRHRKDRDLDSESDTTPDDEDLGKSAPKVTDSQKPRRIAYDQPGPSTSKASIESGLKEDPDRPGTYTNYVRNPPRKDSRP